MKAFVAITDNDWFEFLRRQDGVTEVNFWQPSGGRQFRALAPGQPLLFKLHAPHNVIAGGGFFATFSILPMSIAWETFGVANGAPNRETMHRRIEHYRGVAHDPQADYAIGCLVLEDTFFLDEANWIPVPEDFSRHTQVGKTYDLTTGFGDLLWKRVVASRAKGAQTRACCCSSAASSCNLTRLPPLLTLAIRENHALVGTRQPSTKLPFCPTLLPEQSIMSSKVRMQAASDPSILDPLAKSR